MKGRFVRSDLGHASKEPDLVVLALWGLLVGTFAYTRKDFLEEGVRHLPHILSSQAPALGEPRWLLFPALVFAVVRPLVAAGAIADLASAIKPLLVLSFVAGLTYLVALRRCLVARGVSAPCRAAALTLSGFSAPVLMLGSDTAEPLIAAAIAVAGLAYAATAGQDAPQSRRSAIVAMGAIALATLVYQGLIVAMLLVPCVVPGRALLDRKTIVVGTAIVALIPAVLVAGTLIQGNTVSQGLERVLLGEQNPLYRTYLKSSSISRYFAVVLAGPSQGVVSIPNFRGMRVVIRMLKEPSTTLKGVGSFAVLACGLFVVVTGMANALRRRDWAILLAFGSMFILPLVRNQQYSDIKFYVLVPAVLGLAASHIPLNRVWLAAIIVAILNCAFVGRDIMQGRDLAGERIPIYARVGLDACWISSTWGPAIGYKWPGSGCAVLGILAGGRGGDGPAKLDACLQRCFCETGSVFTDDLTVQAGPAIEETLSHFKYPPARLDTVLWRRERGYPLTTKYGRPVLAYSNDVQERICGELRAASRDYLGTSSRD
jgi:hypothetical protein